MRSVAGIPVLGFGTYGRWNDEGEKAIETALETGYRHIDTAQSYNTESECGRAIKASGLARDEVFVTTKINMDNYGPGKLVPSLKSSLDNLGMDHVDLTLIHWPSPRDEVEMPVYLEQLADAHAQGLTHKIGVSNFPIALLKQAKSYLDSIPITANQFELHPYLQNRALAEYCQSQDVAVTAYRPIAEGRVADDPVIQKIAEKHGATPAQVALSFLLDQGYVVIPTSGKADRIRENFGALDVHLDQDDTAALRSIDKHERYIAPDWGPDWDT